MDGKTGAEELIGQGHEDPSAAGSLAAPPSPEGGLTGRAADPNDSNKGETTMAEAQAIARQRWQGVTFEGNDLASLLQQGVQAQDRRGQERRRAGGADAGAAGAVADPS
jgi:hypothetical protein